MTSKHFIALAAAVSKLRNTDERKRMMQEIGRICAQHNQHFDWVRWVKACKLNQPKR